MKRIVLLWLFLGFSLFIHAQTITITDQQTEETVELATLVSNTPRAFALTNSRGQADISAFRGSEEIEIRKLGYKTIRRSFQQLEEADFMLELRKSQLNLDEVVVSATRWSQTSGDVPSKITSISTEEVALQNPQTAADLLAVSGEVYIQKSQQGGGSPMIRGFATNRLLYTVDGVRMNTAIFRGGNLQNVISLDPFAIENTEVLFGPGSVIYGSDAIGGVMSFQTLTPQLSLEDKPLVTGKAIARFSTANSERTGHFNVNVGWKRWAFLSSISAFDYGHVRQGSHGPDDYLKNWHVQNTDSTDRVIRQNDELLQVPSAYSQHNIMQKIRFRPDDHWDFQYGFHYSETSSYGRYDRHNRIRNGTPRYGQWDYGPQTWMMNNLNATHDANNKVYDQMTARLAWQSFGESRISRNFNDDWQSQQIESVEAYSANLDFIKSTSSSNKIFYGAEAVLNTVESSAFEKNIYTGAKQDMLTRYPESDWSSIAVYLKDQYNISEKFVLQGGVRYSHFSLNSEFDTTHIKLPYTSASLNNGALTGNIGLIMHPTSHLVVKANLSTGFRSPNVDDIGKVFDSEPGAVVVPNPELTSEYAYNADLGIAKKFDDLVKVELTAYYSILENALVRRDYSLNGQDSMLYDGVMSRIQAIQNAASATRYGVQASFEFKISEHLLLSSSINFQDGEDELDDGSKSAPRHAAPLFGNTRLSYSNEKLSMELYAVYQGERSHEDLAVSEQDKTEIYALDENGNTYAPAWYTLNFKSMYKITDMFSVSAGVENITDQRYRPYSSGISAPGRNFFIALRTNF